MSAEHPLWHDIQQGEGKTLEFKRQLPKGEQLAKPCWWCRFTGAASCLTT
ncbi:hypothetical protein [Zobellella denitrificans]|nr:hypothetical protein [Zobellella denitrificans]